MLSLARRVRVELTNAYANSFGDYLLYPLAYRRIYKLVGCDLNAHRLPRGSWFYGPLASAICIPTNTKVISWQGAIRTHEHCL